MLLAPKGALSSVTPPKCHSPEKRSRSQLEVWTSLHCLRGSILKILAAVMLLALLGCSRQSQRFVPFVENDTILALDTETGKTCVSYKQAALANEGTPMPYCADLYNSK
jgi:hypothetical protein